MKISSLARGLLFMIGGQVALSAMGVYSPSLWFVAGWVLCLIDHMLETALNKKMKVIEVSSEKSLMLGIPLEYKLFRYMKNCYEYLKK